MTDESEYHICAQVFGSGLTVDVENTAEQIRQRAALIGYPIERYEEMASPQAGTVRDVWGDPCPQAKEHSYPLGARCENCRADIRCADPTAAWHHRRTGQCRCEVR